MLSPYRGVMHSVVTEWADAVTIDGRNWTLYVRGECLYDDPCDLQDRSISVPDVKYGTWSEQAGFRRAPIRLPTFDGRVRDEGDSLLRAVQQHAHALPFPLADRFELWLLHAQTGRPLALIASSCNADDRATPSALRWTPGQLCMAQLEEARALRDIIAHLAGRAPQACWFERRADDSGLGQDGAHALQTLPAEHFDQLLIDRTALSSEQEPMLAALHHWQAPALLQLPTLSMAQRVAFEQAACQQALRLAEQLPLYPCVLDTAAITAALVEARLRRVSMRGARGETESRTLSPDYIEIPEP